MTSPIVTAAVLHDKSKGPEAADVYFLTVKAKSGEHFSSHLEYEGKKFRAFGTVGKAVKDMDGSLTHTLRAVLA